MCLNSSIRKIFITTMSIFIVLFVFSINVIDKRIKNVLDYQNVFSNKGYIYLMDENNYLVRYNIFFDENDKTKKVEKVLNNLKNSNISKHSNKLYGTIPNDVEVLSVISGNEYVTIDFSKEFLNVSEDIEKQMISSIVYSIIGIDNTKAVNILIDGNKLEMYPNSKEKLSSSLGKEIGINNQYNVLKREDINSVIVYYLERIDDEVFYVPVTKYVNDDRDKIKIIIDELTTSYIYENNLMSFLNNKVKLLDYREENDVMFLNFNEFLYDSYDRVLEEVLYCISYSVFDNYDVSVVMIEVEGDIIKMINK